MDQQLIIQIQLIEQEANQLNEQLQLIEQNIRELDDLKESLEEINKRGGIPLRYPPFSCTNYCLGGPCCAGTPYIRF